MRFRALAVLVGVWLALARSARAADAPAAAPDAVAIAPVLSLAEALRAAHAHHPALVLARGP